MLTHYIIVRRDLPLGTLAAQITHAAGESGALYQDDYDGRFRGATAVVLEVKNEDKLKDTMKLLLKHGIPSVVVREPSPPWDGSFMAIGLVPCAREKVSDILKEYQTLKACNIDPEPLKLDDGAASDPIPRFSFGPHGPEIWRDDMKLEIRAGSPCTCTNCREEQEALDKPKSGV